MKPVILTAALIPLTLAACASRQASEPSLPSEPVTACRADKVQSLLGQPLTPTLTKQAQERATARTVRVIRPGQAVTMDYRTDRLNIELDSTDRITALRCG